MDRDSFAGRDDLDTIDDLDWQVRAAIYTSITSTGRTPAVVDIATQLHQAAERIALAFIRLHRRHAIFLQPGSLAIRMAHPFSGVPTRFEVSASGRGYYANCAWDMLGIPAAMRADATIHARFADASNDANDAVTLRIHGDQLDDHGEVVHFPVPFHAWYDDLIHT